MTADEKRTISDSAEMLLSWHFYAKLKDCGIMNLVACKLEKLKKMREPVLKKKELVF